jgi:transposase
LECGRYHFPETTGDQPAVELTAGQFQMVLDGIDLSRVRRFKRFSPPSPGKALPGD